MYRSKSQTPYSSGPRVSNQSQDQILNYSVLGEDLSKEEKACLMGLGKFEFFGGRVKKSIVQKLVKEIGQEAAMRNWKMSREEFN